MANRKNDRENFIFSTMDKIKNEELEEQEETILKYQNQIQQFEEELLEMSFNPLALAEGGEGGEGCEPTFDDQNKLNLVMSNVDALREEMKEFFKFGIDSLMMNKEIFQRLDCSFNKIKEDIEFIKTKISKKIIRHKSIPLRDPITPEIFKLLLFHAGHLIQKMVVPKKIQLRLTYLMLYLTGLRINEVALLTYSDFQKIIDTGQFEVDHSKTGDMKFKHTIHKEGIELIKKYQNEIDILFLHEHFQYLGSTATNRQKLMNPKRFINLINTDIQLTLNKCNIEQNIKSHSFRIGFITKLLKATTLQNVSRMVGHKAVNSTMLYNRFDLSHEDKAIILQKAFQLD